MPNTAITSIQAVINSKVVSTATAATANVADAAEVFDITPAKKDGKFLIEINNVATNQGTVTFSLAAGDFWAGVSALTGSVAQGTSGVIEVETAKYKQSDGTLTLTITPASGKRLLTDHTLTLSCVQLS